VVPVIESFPTPEAAALATWGACPNANARVVSVEVRGDQAQVVVETDPSYPDYVSCLRTDEGWIASASGNGSTVSWGSASPE
jgi:hypothetical protein